jgi:two-component sensor histidine kinase
LFHSFKSRIAVLLLLANLPAVLVAVAAGVASYGDGRALQELSVRQAADLLASRAAEVLGTARGVLSTLALDPALLQGGEGCQRKLDAIRLQNVHHSGVFLADQDGRLLCASGSVPDDQEDRAALSSAIGSNTSANAVVFLAESSGQTSQRVVAARPVRLGGVAPGILALTIDRGVFDALFGDLLPRPRYGAILTDAGQTLAVDPAAASEGWRPEISLHLPEGTEGFKAAGSDGSRRFYVTAPVPGTTAYVLVARPESIMGAQDQRQLMVTIGIPLAMIAFGIIAVLLGLNRFILRWVRRLRATTADYTAGRYDQRVEGLETAPREIADLARGFNVMADAVMERSTALEHALGEKDRILRELHHRVKNNFQMIASLLALQRRELPSDVRPLLRVPEDRVLAMAAAHKASYATGEIGHVPVLDLLSDVALQIRQSFGARAPRIAVEAEAGAAHAALDLDRAVPLALLVSELVSAALDRSAGEAITIGITLEEDPDEALKVDIAAVAVSEALPRTALPGRLVTAYVAQLHARLETEEADRLRVVMPGPILRTSGA